MDFNKIFQSKFFQGCLISILVFLVLLLTFRIGMMVGVKKAEFSHQWGDNYIRNFAGRDKEPFPGFDDRDLVNGHGLFGQIVKIDNSSIIINDQDKNEKIVQVTGETIIKRFKDDINLSDLKTDEKIVVVGDPNDSGVIDAKIIRVMPEPPFPFSLFAPEFPKSDTAPPSTMP